MARWSKHFQSVNLQRSQNAAMARSQGGIESSGAGMNYGNFLPEVYAGHPQRIERYTQYDQMDQDPEISTALDTISDFSTRRDEKTEEMFTINFIKDVGDSEIEALRIVLRQWSKVNGFKKRLWRMFRSTLKYGDQFFIRDPETLCWYWVDQSKVESVIVNEAEGKTPESYLIRDLDLNLQSLTATMSNQYGSNIVGAGTGTLSQMSNRNRSSGVARDSRFATNQSTVEVDAIHVVHLSLSEGLDANWPFGTSILESVFTTFRQKSLIEDAILIYRIQRAPERRVYYVDVGNMPPHKASAYIERMKNEMHQRRFPSRNGMGQSSMDATYNPLSTMEDIFFAQTSEGRGSRIDTLPGGENLGQIDDLRYFQNKLKRGLGVPSSYSPSGPEDGTAGFSDGRLGTAYIQEFRFSEYCSRLQNLLSPTFDEEFKLFAKQRGVNVDASCFELNLQVPQNFGEYAMLELDAARINIYQALADIPTFSDRWLKKTKLGMTDEEIMDNEDMWAEENPDAVANLSELNSGRPAGLPGLEGVGVGVMDDSEPVEDTVAEPVIDDGSVSPISGDESEVEEEM